MALLAASVAALRELTAPARPNVLMLSVESTRAEDFTAENLPHVFAAGRDAARFTAHRAVSAWTAPNVIAFLSGLSPFAQGVHARGQSVPARWRLPLEDLAAAGWQVAGLQSFMALDVYANLGLTLDPGADPRVWMARRARAHRPFFLWTHYVGTHLPYAPLPPYRPDWQALLPPGDAAARARLQKVMTAPAIPAGSVAFEAGDRAAVRALYRGGLRQFDDWFANLWGFLGRTGLLRNTIVVLTADHGEELLERGNVGHASTTRAAQLGEEIVRIPLMVWLPPRYRGRLPPGVYDRPTDHLDIMPLLFDLLGMTPSRPFAGTSPLGGAPPRPWNAVSSRAGFAEPDPDAVRSFVAARREGDWKLRLRLTDGAVTARALYDLARDPGERDDVSRRNPEVTRRLEVPLRGLLAAMRPPSPAGRGAAPAAAADRPSWIFPAASGRYGYDDLGGRFRLEWSGAAGAAYVLQYQAGEGLLALSGELEVTGTEKDFGIIARDYWNTWIVPYGRFRIRVRPAGREDLWSDWLDLVAVRSP